MARLAACWLATVMALQGLTGCAGLPARGELPASTWRATADDTPLGQLTAAHQVPAGRSAFRPLLQPEIALQTRLALIKAARVGINLQTYPLGDDATGHELLRALADAADRGVRVRLLIDDFHSLGLTDLLLGLAAHVGAEVRRYNPFPAGRDNLLGRIAGLAGDFSRLNRRMHNKLLVADGRAAIVGGRNLTDAYVMRNQQGNFLDLELLAIGQVIGELGHSFDHYWNSVYAVPVQALADNPLDKTQRRDALNRLTLPQGLTVQTSWAAGAAAAATELQTLPLSLADATVHYDNTAKTGGGGGSPGGGPPLPIGHLVRNAREQPVVLSPYCLPHEQGIQLLRGAHRRGVAVQVLTNSMVDTDEPLVSLAYGKRRHEFLGAGMRLFEMSSEKFKLEQGVRTSLGRSVARLHAKLGLLDGHLLLIGSVNVDPRSANTNTELALVIDSAELLRSVQGHFNPSVSRLAHEVRLAADGRSLDWITIDDQGQEHLSPEPALPPWRLMMLWLMSRFVPDSLPGRARNLGLQLPVTGLLAWKRGQPGQVGNEAALTVVTSAEVGLVTPPVLR